MDVSFETRIKKNNVAVIEIDVLFETLIKNQRCRYKNGRFVRDFCKKITFAVVEMDVSLARIAEAARPLGSSPEIDQSPLEQWWLL